MLYVNQCVNCSHTCSYSMSRPSMSNTPKLSQFVLGILRFDLICKASIHTTGSQDPWNNDTWTFHLLKMWQQTSVDLYEAHYNSTRFAPSRVSHKIDFQNDESTTGKTICVDSMESSQIDNIFNPPCIVHQKSRSMKWRYMNLPCSTNFSWFVRFVSIQSNRVESTTFLTHPTLSRSALFSMSRANRLPACRFDSRGNHSCRFNGIGFTNRFPVSRITNTKDESTLRLGVLDNPRKCSLLYM